MPWPRRPHGPTLDPVTSSQRGLAIAGLAVALIAVAWAIVRAVGRRRLVSTTDRATYETLHTASLAARPLRDGLTPQAAAKAAKYLRNILGVEALAIIDVSGVLAWEGEGEHHRGSAPAQAEPVLRNGRTIVLREGETACADPACLLRSGVVAAVVADDRVVAALSVFVPVTTSGLVRATQELAMWSATQIELAELGRQRSRVMEAELRALRAQISPHFIYNCLATIASFVRTDPDRARELLLEFADFTRYAFRRGGDYTTLADELGNIERYLELEHARFGDRLQVSLVIAPESLPVAVPFLAIQPLVENAVKHGIEAKAGVGHITITATSVGAEAQITIEDDGIGADPDTIREILSGECDRDSVGLGNVDARLRQAYGDGYGLVVETAPDAGTKVSFRVPKFAPGIHAQM